MTNFPHVSRKGVTTEVAEHLERMILSGELAEGTRLPSEKELGSFFGVSRNGIREALKSLGERGLVSVRNGRGAFVTAPPDEILRAAIARHVRTRLTLDTLSDFYQFREVLEGAAARIAASRADENDLRWLDAALEAMRVNETNVNGWMDADIAFHRALIGATHNPFLVTVLEPVIDCLRAAIEASFDLEGARTGLACHAAIVRSIHDRDPVGAQAAVLSTLTDSAARVKRVLGEGESNE